MDRDSTRDFLSGEPLDVLIVGAGIVGSGIARDAAMRGLRVGLVEQYDVAAGTSGRSSRLLHGGLRYLAQGRVGLVRESSREKKTLARIAPHLAQPLAFIFPSYKGTGWPLWKLTVGVKVYDWLCGGNLGSSTSLSSSDLLTLLPDLNPNQLTGAVRYYDALTSDARLVIDTLRSAAGHGAHILTHAKLHDVEKADGLWSCRVEDAVAGSTLTVRARSVVSATGPWGAQSPNHSLNLRLTKGVHLVVKRDRLPIPDAVVMTEGKRILFCIPWGDRTVIGTTDTDFEGRVEDVSVGHEDVSYILNVVNRHFASTALTANDVVSEWAGLRPLIADFGASESEISRTHKIAEPATGWIEVGGGKLTTYRLMAEEVVDRLVRTQQLSATPCRTEEEPLLPRSETEGVSQVLPPLPSQSLVEHYCAKEWALHVEDVMIRRTRWHHYVEDRSALADQVADWMQQSLGWSDAQRESERTAYVG